MFFFLFRFLETAYQNTELQLFWRKFSSNSVLQKSLILVIFFKILIFVGESNSTLLKTKLMANGF